MKQTIGRVTGSVLPCQLDDLGQRAAGLLEPQFMHLKNGCDFSASPRVSGGIMARAQEVAILNILSVIINSAHGEGESGPQGYIWSQRAKADTHVHTIALRTAVWFPGSSDPEGMLGSEFDKLCSWKPGWKP